MFAVNCDVVTPAREEGRLSHHVNIGEGGLRDYVYLKVLWKFQAYIHPAESVCSDTCTFHRLTHRQLGPGNRY